ncbi:helix-turn-helix domain-containing protein [Paenibacillus sp. NPDC057967]|uniref:helix-turn-helix domain-containing protein n=1 Tax=Paenibacillus sp. NPDC057967 TaxID=3346293 RepID=UPI0036DBAD56
MFLSVQLEGRRQRILDAARDIFTLRSITATKMSDIAEQAGLSRLRLKDRMPPYRQK